MPKIEERFHCQENEQVLREQVRGRGGGFKVKVVQTRDSTLCPLLKSALYNAEGSSQAKHSSIRLSAN